MGAPGAHLVEFATLRLSPGCTDVGSIPARGPLLHALPYLPLYHKAYKCKNKS